MIEATERGAVVMCAPRADWLCHDGDSVNLAGLISPCIEVRLAFVLKRALPVHGWGERDVIAAVDSVAPSITLSESKIRQAAADRRDAVRSAAPPARVVIGWGSRVVDSVDLADFQAQLYSGYRWREVLVTRGTAFVSLGNPANLLVLPTRERAASGARFGAGDIVLSSSCTGAIEVAAGDHYRAEFAGVGSVSVDFC